MSRKNEPLHNYLRTFRLKSSLSQADLAALVGASGSLIRKHESGVGLPELKTALAYEAVLGAPISELYAGVDEAVRFAVRNFARTLREKVEREKDVPAARLTLLTRLAEMPGGHE